MLIWKLARCIKHLKLCIPNCSQVLCIRYQSIPSRSVKELESENGFESVESSKLDLETIVAIQIFGGQPQDRFFGVGQSCAAGELPVVPGNRGPCGRFGSTEPFAHFCEEKL